MRGPCAAAVGLLLLAGCTGAPAASGEVVALDWELVRTLPHDPTSFTQGLEVIRPGLLAESSGRYGASRVSLVDLESGEPVASAWLPDEHFGEGLTLVGDRLLQLTWQEEVAHAWDVEDLAPAGSFSYEGEGWGLCHDEGRGVLWRSDGSSQVMSHHIETFGVTSTVGVQLDGEPLDRLNELECVDGDLWANVWQTDQLVRFSPEAGIVDAVADLSELAALAEEANGRPFTDDEVLNGIAHSPETDTWFVTGKHWPELYEIRIREG